MHAEEATVSGSLLLIMKCILCDNQLRLTVCGAELFFIKHSGSVSVLDTLPLLTAVKTQSSSCTSVMIYKIGHDYVMSSLV